MSVTFTRGSGTPTPIAFEKATSNLVALDAGVAHDVDRDRLRRLARREAEGAGRRGVVAFGAVAVPSSVV